MSINEYSFANRFKFIFFDDDKKFLNSSIISCNVPSISASVIERRTVGTDLKYPGDKMQFDDFRINFKLEENYRNYLYLFQWMQNNVILDQIKKSEMFASGNLNLLTSKYEHVVSMLLSDILPYNMSEIEYDIKNNKSNILQFSASFAVNNMTIDQE